MQPLTIQDVVVFFLYIAMLAAPVIAAAMAFEVDNTKRDKLIERPPPSQLQVVNPIERRNTEWVNLKKGFSLKAGLR